MNLQEAMCFFLRKRCLGFNYPIILLLNPSTANFDVQHGVLPLTGVGKCTFLGILNITFKYLLDLNPQ